MAKKPTQNAEAYVLYLQALPFEQGPDTLLEDYRQAVDLYARAIQLDPDFASRPGAPRFDLRGNLSFSRAARIVEEPGPRGSGDRRPHSASALGSAFCPWAMRLLV